MRRVLIFSLLLILSAGSLAAFISWMFYSFASMTSSDWMLNMMNRMMAGQFSAPPGSTFIFSPWMTLLPTTLIGTIILGTIGIAYFMLFPEVPRTKISEGEVTLYREVQGSVEALMRTLTPEERKVLEVLLAHGGKYLQKYIRKEAELSRLKTHRIVSRFAQRGIVKVRKFGNTNEVEVADWLKKGEPLLHG